jgi:2,4-diaminopentanoate dehydrogenase
MLATPGFVEMAWKAPIYLIAAGLGVEVERVNGTLDRELTDRDIEVAFGTVKAGTCRGRAHPGPDIHCAMTLGAAEGHGAGHAAMVATAMRVVNAIPYVVDAAPGLLSSLDIPTTLPRHAFD